MKKLITICLVAAAFIDAQIAHGGHNLAWMYFLEQSNDVLWTANLDKDNPEPSIDPKILGVVFTMIQIYGSRAISSQRPFIAQTRSLGVPVFESYIRENKSIFGDAPQYGAPVVLNAYSPGTHNDVVGEIEGFVSEFASKLQL